MAFFYSYLQDTDRPSLKSTDQWAIFGVFKIGKQITWIWMRNENRNSGISNLEQTRTEMQIKNKENIFNFQQKDQFLKQNKTGGIMLRKIHFFFLQHSLNPLRVFSSLFKKANFQNMQKNKICLVIFSFLNRHYKISTSRFMQIWNS